VVDHFHLVRLANQMLTEVRQRVTREHHGRRGRRTDPAWAHRRLLLAAGNRLSHRGLDRLSAVLAADDPTNEIGAAWVAENPNAAVATVSPHPLAAVEDEASRAITAWMNSRCLRWSSL